MKTILVASSKGGVGKTTIATHLAANAALSGQHTVLVDADPQRSSTRWAEKRADMDSAVLPVDGSNAGRGWQRDLPEDTQYVVVDAAAGAMAHELMPFLERADAVVVPVVPSTLDIEATVPFLDTLAKLARVRRGELPIALVGNKLRPWTNASQQAMDLWKAWPYPWWRRCATARPIRCCAAWARACSTTTRRRSAITRRTGSRCYAGCGRPDPRAPLDPIPCVN